MALRFPCVSFYTPARYLTGWADYIYRNLDLSHPPFFIKGTDASPTTTPQEIMTQKTTPISVRFNRDELKHIAKVARKLELSRSEYIRQRSLGHGSAIAKGAILRTSPQLLAQILGKLGGTALSASLAEFAMAAQKGHIELDDEQKTQLATACADIAATRRLLLKALGLRQRSDQ